MTKRKERAPSKAVIWLWILPLLSACGGPTTWRFAIEPAGDVTTTSSPTAASTAASTDALTTTQAATDTSTPESTPAGLPTETATVTVSSTPQETPTPTDTPLPTATPPPTEAPPTPTPTPLPGFNGYWLSPIDAGSDAYIGSYQNLCAAYLDGSDPTCIQNWMGEKGTFPDDFWEILVCPSHTQGWDITWDHQGARVYAVQGGQVSQITLEENSSLGVHFFVIDRQYDGWYAADYGHVNLWSLVDQGIIDPEQANRVAAGQVVDGAYVWEGQLLGVTGDDCCLQGMLHIGAAFLLNDISRPSELWQRGSWPDVCDCRPTEVGIPCQY